MRPYPYGMWDVYVLLNATTCVLVNAPTYRVLEDALTVNP
jgi:hypothetical protein